MQQYPPMFDYSALIRICVCLCKTFTQHSVKPTHALDFICVLMEPKSMNNYHAPLEVRTVKIGFSWQKMRG